MTEPANKGGAVATIVTTAAVTLAIGITVAALAGYLGPQRDPAAVPGTPPVESAASLPAAPPAAPVAPAAPSVVLVPIAEQRTMASAIQPVEAAPFEARHHDDDDDGDHRERGGHHDDDDDDEDGD